MTNETKCETDLIKLEFEINNGDYVIYEYCSELVRQVQQAKEEEIERLENLAETFMKEIGDYKKEITDKYMNDKAFKSKFMQRLNLLQEEALSSTLKDLEFKIEVEKRFIQSSIFNGKMMKFDKALPQNQPIGMLEINEVNVIDADLNLVTKAHLNIPNEDKTNLNKNKCVHYKYFSSGECFLAFETNSSQIFDFCTFDFYVLNKDKTIKTTQKNIQAFCREYSNNTFYVFQDRLAFQQYDGKVLVYDNNLKLLKKYENVLIGADEKFLYFVNWDNKFCIEKSDWSYNYSPEEESRLMLEDIFLDISFPSDLYSLSDISDINFDTDKLNLFRSHKGIYYFIDGASYLNVVKSRYEDKLKLLNRIDDVSRYEIDSNGNLIVFHCFCGLLTTRTLTVGFYDLNGEHKYDLNLVNFYKHLKEEDFPTWKDLEIVQDNWIYSMTIEQSGQRFISFFDIETFSFKNIVCCDSDQIKTQLDVSLLRQKSN